MGELILGPRRRQGVVVNLWFGGSKLWTGDKSWGRGQRQLHVAVVREPGRGQESHRAEEGGIILPGDGILSLTGYLMHLNASLIMVFEDSYLTYSSTRCVVADL